MPHVAIGYRWFPTSAGYHFERAFDALGHQATYVGLNSAERPGYGETTSIAAIIGQMQEKPDLFLWIDPAARYFPLDIEALSIPTACYLIDTHLGEWRKGVAKFFDVVFLAQKDYVEEFKATIGHNQVYWLPLAAAEDVHFDHQIERIYDVGFVGNLIHEHKQSGRARRLELIAKHFHTNELYRPYQPAEVGQIYSQSKIVFNNSIAGDVTMRLFEGTACGALVLTNETKNGIDELFEPGKEIISFRDDEDLIAKIHYYLNHPDELEKIAQAGKQRTLGQHLYQHRCQQIVDRLNQPEFQRIAPMRLASAAECREQRRKVYTHLHMTDAILDDAKLSQQNPLQRAFAVMPCLLRRILR